MKNTARIVNLGIIGCGEATETFHLPSLKSLDNVNVYALSDPDEIRLSTLGDKFKVKNLYDDPDELINHPEVEAIAVCAPSEYHFSLGMSALTAGKHLFLEKPVALRLEESEKLIKKAADCSLKAFPGFNLRWHRNVRKVKVCMQNNILGPIRLIRSVITANQSNVAEWRKNRGLGGGAIIDLAIHHFDLLSYLFDAEVEEVYAKSISSDIQDEAALVTLKMSDDILSSSVFSCLSSIGNEIEIYGHLGSLKISLYDIDGIEFRSASATPSKLISIISSPFQKAMQIASNARTLSHGGIFNESYHGEWQSFLDSVIYNKDVECSLEDGRRALKIALSAVDSILAGKPIKLV